MKIWKLVILTLRGELNDELEKLKILCLNKWCKMIGVNNANDYLFYFTVEKPILAKMDLTEATWTNYFNCLAIYEASQARMINCNNKVSRAILNAKTILAITEKLETG